MFLDDVGMLFFLYRRYKRFYNREGGLNKNRILKNGLIFRFLIVIRSAIKTLLKADVSNP